MTENSVVNFKQISIALPDAMGVKARVDLKTKSQPFSENCLIKASNDIEAVACWVKKHEQTRNTVDAYLRQAKFLLYWCVYESGKTLAQLRVEDFEHYFQFLKAPPKSWCATRSALRGGVHSVKWRPFVGGLKVSGIKMHIRILNSLLNYLVNSGYLRANPLKLMPKQKAVEESISDNKYAVWGRILAEDEWAAVQHVLENLPETDNKARDHKNRTQFIFAMFYFLGLRISELTSHTWNAFRFKDNKWWFFVRGKGGELGHIPAHDSLMQFVKLYRICLKKSPLPENHETDRIIVSYTGKPIQVRQIYNVVKTIGNLAAQEFKEEPQKAERLKKLSPHWLRHLSASHQDRAGVPLTMIQENLRHKSRQTTQIYLHGEDKARHESIQKLGLKFSADLSENKKMYPKMLCQIILSNGPVHVDLGCQQFIESFESQVLKDLFWERRNFDKKKLLEWIRASIMPIEKITLSYLLEEQSAQNQRDLKQSIELEATVRLFKAKIAFIKQPKGRVVEQVKIWEV